MLVTAIICILGQNCTQHSESFESKNQFIILYTCIIYMECCLQEVFPAELDSVSHLRLFEECALLFVKSVGNRGGLRMGSSAFRGFIRYIQCNVFQFQIQYLLYIIWCIYTIFALLSSPVLKWTYSVLMCCVGMAQQWGKTP